MEFALFRWNTSSALQGPDPEQVREEPVLPVTPSLRLCNLRENESVKLRGGTAHSSPSAIIATASSRRTATRLRSSTDNLRLRFSLGLVCGQGTRKTMAP